MSAPPDGTLRTSPVTVSFLNPQTNSYTQVGKTYVVAMRKSGNVLICILGPNRQPFAAVPATAQINWDVQNDVYCSFIDTSNRRFLLLFDSAEEARVFTAIALAAKLAASQDPICIVAKEGAPIPQNDRFSVNYACYDFMQPKIDKPVMVEQNFEISPIDETPLKSISKNGTQGSIFLVQYPHRVIAIVESIANEQPLPALPGSAPPQELPSIGDAPEQSEIAPAKAEEAPKKSKKRKTEAPKPEEEPEAAPAPASVPAQTHAPEPQPQPQQVKPAPRPNEVKPQPMYDSQLESIRNEMQEKFNELSQMVASLRRTQAVQNNVALTSDVLVSSVQRLLKENQAKDQLIAEKQQLIDLLNERHTDTRERDAMRIQLAELGSKLSAQRQLTKEKTEQQKELNDQIESLQAEIVKAKVEAESKLAILHQQLEDEKQKQSEELEASKKQLEWNVKTAEEEVTKIRAQFEKAMSENKSLKQQTSRDVSAELAKMKAAVPSLIQRTVKQMVSGVYEMIEQNFDEDEEYDGVAIMKAIRTALQRQAQEMLDQIDPQDDEEEEED